MRRVIIESPFSSGTPVSIPAVVARNVRYARACMRAALLRGDAPYASHLLYTQEGVLDDTVPEERKLGMEAGWAWGVSDATVLMHMDLGISSGMHAGAVRAEKAGLQVDYILLGGYWAKCDAEKCIAPTVTMAGPRHAYGCPMWRVS